MHAYGMPTTCLRCQRHAYDMPTMTFSLRMARPPDKLGGWLAHLTNETILYAQADGQQMWPTCVV